MNRTIQNTVLRANYTPDVLDLLGEIASDARALAQKINALSEADCDDKTFERIADSGFAEDAPFLDNLAKRAGSLHDAMLPPEPEFDGSYQLGQIMPPRKHFSGRAYGQFPGGDL